MPSRRPEAGAKVICKCICEGVCACASETERLDLSVLIWLSVKKQDIKLFFSSADEY